MNENPIKPISSKAKEKESSKPLRTYTVKVGRGKFMDGGSSWPAGDEGGRTVPPGYRPKRGRFMES